LKPLVGNSNLRNDIRIRSQQTCSLSSADIDLTISSLDSSDHLSSTDFARPPARSELPRITLDKRTQSVLTKVMDKVRLRKQTKIDKITTYHDAHLFQTLPFTSGGFADAMGEALLERWGEQISRPIYNRLLHSISIALVKNSAVGFRLS
jgi:hypothetical protein